MHRDSDVKRLVREWSRDVDVRRIVKEWTDINVARFVRGK